MTIRNHVSFLNEPNNPWLVVYPANLEPPSDPTLFSTHGLTVHESGIWMGMSISTLRYRKAR
jgi:hypothetical protein